MMGREPGGQGQCDYLYSVIKGLNELGFSVRICTVGLCSQAGQGLKAGEQGGTPTLGSPTVSVPNI